MTPREHRRIERERRKKQLDDDRARFLGNSARVVALLDEIFGPAEQSSNQAGLPEQPESPCR